MHIITSEVSQWGNGLAVRINRTLAHAANLKKGTKINIEIDEQGLHIQRIEPAAQTAKLALPFSEADLLEGITPYLAHTDELATLSPYKNHFLYWAANPLRN